MGEAERKARSDAFLARAKTLIARADAVGIGAQLDGGRLSLTLDDVARLLDSYEQRAVVAEEIAQAIEAAGRDPYRNLAWMYPEQAAGIAREKSQS